MRFKGPNKMSFKKGEGGWEVEKTERGKSGPGHIHPTVWGARNKRSNGDTYTVKFTIKWISRGRLLSKLHSILLPWRANLFSKLESQGWQIQKSQEFHSAERQEKRPLIPAYQSMDYFLLLANLLPTMRGSNHAWISHPRVLTLYYNPCKQPPFYCLAL